MYRDILEAARLDLHFISAAEDLENARARL